MEKDSTIRHEKTGFHSYSRAELMAAEAGGIDPRDLPAGAAEIFAAIEAEEYRLELLRRPESK